jgi:hypothetical protein
VTRERRERAEQRERAERERWQASPEGKREMRRAARARMLGIVGNVVGFIFGTLLVVGIICSNLAIAGVADSYDTPGWFQVPALIGVAIVAAVTVGLLIWTIRQFVALLSRRDVRVVRR